MQRKTKIRILIFTLILIAIYQLFNITDDTIYYKFYSPDKQYSVYAKKFSYYRYLKLNFPGSRSSDAPGKVYVYDEINKKVISTAKISMIGNMNEMEWGKDFVYNKGEVWIDLPRKVIFPKKE